MWIIRLYWAAALLLYMSVGLDLGTTWQAMHFGWMEANPLMKQSKVRHVVLALGTAIGADLMARHFLLPSPLALLILSPAGFHFWAAWHNLRIIPIIPRRTAGLE